MVEYSLILCDNCNNDITLYPNDILTRDIGVDDSDQPVEETYFICPACKSKYTIAVTDSRLRFMIENQKQFTKGERRAYELDLRARYKAELEEG